MAEFGVTQSCEYSPTGCRFCGGDLGPFVNVLMNGLAVSTPNGPFYVHGHVYVCIGTEEQPGCVMQMARLAGCLDPAQAKRLLEDYDAARTLAKENAAAALKLRERVGEAIA